MNNHNIGFYEDLTKIIFELSSNIIKFASYFFCCHCIWKQILGCHEVSQVFYVTYECKTVIAPFELNST